MDVPTKTPIFNQEMSRRGYEKSQSVKKFNEEWERLERENEKPRNDLFHAGDEIIDRTNTFKDGTQFETNGRKLKMKGRKIVPDEDIEKDDKKEIEKDKKDKGAKGNFFVNTAQKIKNSAKRNTFDRIQNRDNLGDQIRSAFGGTGEDSEDTRKWRWAGGAGFFFGSSLGLLCGILLINYIYDLLKPGCESVNGSICNAPYGYCTEYGVCNCISPLVSGLYCEQQACPDGCKNGGVCSPWLENAENIAEPCRHINRTPQNGFKIFETGWDNPACISRRQELAFKQFTLGIELTPQEASSLPTCLCFGFWYGPDCTLNLAPQSADLKVCSGYGNDTVGYYENGTVGIGAQCNNPLQLVNFPLSNNTILFLELIRPGILFDKFCGDNITVYDDAFFIRASIKNWRCFCDEFHQGEACQLGWCPFDEFGRVCSGNGAPNLGFGLEYNTTIKKHSNCDLICANGYTSCPNPDGITPPTCQKKCGVENVCPPERPYRCRDLSCVSGTTNYNGQGETGYLENVTFRSFVLNEPFYQLDITSPLIAMEFVEGSMNVSYYNTNYNTSFNFTDRVTVNQLQPFVVTIIDNQYLQSQLTGPLTLIGLNGLRTYVQVQSQAQVTLVNTSTTYFLLNGSDLFTALLADGTGTVGIESCLSEYTLCEFTLNNSQYEPFTPNGTFYPQPFVIANAYVVLYGPELSNAYPYSVLDASRTIPESPPVFLFLTPGYFNVTVRYILQEDITLEDACSPYQSVGIYFENSNNQSYFNELWYSETFRKSSNFIAGLDYIVYFSFISNAWERGLFYAQINETLWVQNIMMADIIETFTTAKKISRSEHFGGGLVQCPSYLFFYNNRCVRPTLIQNNYNVTCQCYLQECACEDGSLVNTTKTIGTPCVLYANGIYRDIRWIYAEGNYTQEAQRFGGFISYGYNVTEVYYGNFSNLTDGINWTIGGYYPLGWQITNFTVSASSNTTFTQYLNQTSFTNYWQASVNDRSVLLNISSIEKITSVIVHIRNNTIVVGNTSVLIPIQFKASNGQVINITEIGQELVLDLDYPSSWVALTAPYPISVYEFNTWTNQRCNDSVSVKNITIWAIEINTLNQSLVLQQTNASCLYEEQPCLLLNYTDMSYVQFFYTTIEQINTSFLSTNPNLCGLRYSCEDGTCSNTPCVDRYNCRGDGCVQPDSRSKFYKCACAEGWNGLACDLKFCRAITYDITLFEETKPDPHGFCACGGNPPIKQYPTANALLRQEIKTVNKYVEVNRQNVPRINANDVANNFIKPDFAPYGVALTRVIPGASQTIPGYITTCPCARRGSDGQAYLLTDDVLTRSPVTGYVTAWRSYYNYDTKKNETFPWLNECYYDDFPFRCATGNCVRSLSYCLREDNCNGHGTCNADGTCTCTKGWTSFYLTQNISQLMRIPYSFSRRFNLTDPTIWNGPPNTNWRDFYGDWCTVKDCTVKDCSIDALMGCFTGTPPDFKDAEVLCSDLKSCAANSAACVRGNRTSLKLCSGNGIARKRDYRDEWYCQCGFTETERNGFGGPTCSQYTCTEKLNRQFQMVNPKTGERYFNKHGQVLRGKWVGYCGVSIGPDPDNLGDWQRCCPNQELDTCNKVPCVINGKTECVLAEDCIPRNGKPKVYACNNHGTPRADGTCVCDHDTRTGTGYIPDPEIGTDNNCYAKIKCPISPITNTPCAQVDQCSDPKVWDLPPSIPYFNQQIDILLYNLGYAFSNATIVYQVSNALQLQNQKLQAYINLALSVLAAIINAENCICVLSVNDTNNTFPLGMLPYTTTEALTIQPYDKPFQSPFFLPYDGFEILKDGWITSLPYSELQNGTDYLQLPLTITFPRGNRISVIRIHGRSFNAANQTVRFLVNGLQICPLVIIDSEEWGWYPLDGDAQYCDSLYGNFNFETLAEYEEKCVLNKELTQEECTLYKRQNCPGLFFDVSGIQAQPRGCTSDCCVLLLEGQSDEYLQNVTIVQENSTAIITIDQLQFYGYYNETVNPVPPLLFFGENSNCSQNPDSRYAFQILGPDKTYYMGSGTKTIENATLDCALRGAWVATPLSAFGSSSGDVGLAQTCRDSGAAKCLVDGSDIARSRTPSSIFNFFREWCNLWGAYFEADSQLDMYAARNMTIYDTNWVNSSMKPWPSVLTTITTMRSQLNSFAVSPPIQKCIANGVVVATFTECANILSQVLGPLNQYTYTYRLVSFKDFLNYWLPNDVPQNDPYLWDRTTAPLSGVTFNPNIQFAVCLNAVTQSATTCRKFVFESNAAIYNRVGVVDVRVNSNPLVYPCAWENTNPAQWNGYCGTWLRDAFPYEFFGVDLIQWLDLSLGVYCNSPTEPCYNTPSNRYGYGGSPIRGTAKVIRTFPPQGDVSLYSVSYIITAQNSTHVYSYNITELPGNVHTIRFNGVLLGIQVLPATTFHKYAANVHGEQYDKGDDPDLRDRTMGWQNHTYEGMRVFINEQMRFYINVYGTGINEEGFFSAKLSIGPQAFSSSSFAYFNSLQSRGFNLYRNYTRDNLTVVNTVKEPSVYLGSLDDVFTYDTTLVNFVDTALLGRPILPAYLCEVKNRSDWAWNGHTWVPSGGFPNQISVQRDAGIVIMDVMKNGTVRLDEMNRSTEFWRWYVRQSVVNTLDDYLKPKGFAKDWCVVINPQSGKYEPFPCNVPAPFICLLDYTKYTAQEGRVCDVCGPSNRIGGTPQPGQTCIDLFPLANATAYPFEHYILQLYRAGTLNLYVNQNPYDYNVAREFYFRNNKPIVLAIPDFWDLWNADFSNCPGSSIAANPYDCLDFSLTQHFGYDCGSQYSQRTGEIKRRCARDITYCDPDLIFEPVELRNYPTVLNPVLEPSPKSLLCSYSIRPAAYVIQDKYGGKTPVPLDVLSTQINGGLQLLLPAGFTYVYNTGKSYFVFEGNLTFYGTLNFTEGTTGNYTVWIAPLSPTYLYPTTKIVLTTGTISANTEYQVTYNVLENGTYQVLGWDLYVNQQSIVIVSNALVSNNASLQECALGRLGQKRYEPPPAIDSGAGSSRCIYTSTDTVFFKQNQNVGQCYCAPNKGGPSCDCPAINRVSCGNPAYGTCYDNNKCSCTNIGEEAYKKMLVFGTTDYFKVFVQDTIYNEDAYVLLKNSTIRTFIESKTLAVTASTMLPSFINGDEADEFLALESNVPMFVDMERDGDVVIWTDRQIFYEWSSEVLLGDVPIVNQQNWTEEIIGALNFDNSVFGTDGLLTDGSLLYFTNYTTVNVTLTTQSNVYVFATSVNNTLGTCFTISSATGLMPYTIFNCGSGSIGFNVYNVSEYQVFLVGEISPYI